jgi:5-methylcytosine-specific restriction endonuclease McrA
VKDIPLKKQIHREHWMEPTAVTAERPKTDVCCAYCGEDIPWHNSTCRMLKNAYKRRLGLCTYCKKPFMVGDKMLAHVTEKHAAILETLTGSKSTK